MSPSCSTQAQAADVPQFFGSNRDGIIRGARLATDWQTTPPKELWRQPIGAGWGAFAVVGGRAFTQEQRDEEELATCYDLFTGRLLWAHADRARFFESAEEAADFLPRVVERGDLILVKGSRGVHLEKIIEALVASHELERSPAVATGADSGSRN